MKNLGKYKQDLDIIKDIKGKKIALWGVGRVAPDVYEILKNSGHNICCFVDNNPAKIGTNLLNLPIVSEDNIPNIIEYIIATPRIVSRSKINELSKLRPTLAFNKYYSLMHLDMFQEIYDKVFEDEISKTTLENFIQANITGEDSYYVKIVQPNQYYCINEFMEKQNDYVADVGAFVGDSIERYLWINQEFKKIYAFEPSKRQYKALKIRVKRLNEEWALYPNQIEIIKAGVGENPGQIDISNKPKFSNFNIRAIEKGCFEKIKIITLDDYFKDKEIEFIKADIEGSEMAMLRGCKNLLTTKKPKLALCVYHNINDLIDMVEYIHSINPNYKMALRHHTTNMPETVLYCWIG